MENNQTRHVVVSATVHSKEVRTNSNLFDKTIQGFPFLGKLRTQGGGGGGVTQLHSFQAGGFSFLCMDLTHIQVEAEIEIAGENKKDSKEAETQVSNCKFFSFFLVLPPSNDMFLKV